MPPFCVSCLLDKEKHDTPIDKIMQMGVLRSDAEESIVVRKGQPLKRQVLKETPEKMPRGDDAMAVESEVDGTSDDMESTMRRAAMVLPPGSDSGAQAVREGHQ